MSNYKKYKEYKEIIKNYSYALFVMSFDEATICPKKDKENSLNVQNYFQREIIKIVTSDEYFNLLKKLSVATDIDIVDKEAIIKEIEDLEKSRRIPNELRFKGMDIINKSSLTWEEARETLDYKPFLGNLGDLVNYYKDVIDCLKGKYQGYDVLLDDMEDDFTQKMYDEFFDSLKREVLPLMKRILALPKKYNEKLKDVKFDIDKQKKLTKKVCELMGYDDNVGYIGETIHPFTNGININDVRTTTRYDESLLFSNLYSVMHEVGHALYELGLDPKYNETSLSGGTSCAVHESQSRFYENYLGRSKEFIYAIYPLLSEVFNEELKGFTKEDIYYYCNDVCAQFTRTEADELTYPFHVLIRYEIEKKLFNNEITVMDIENEFNKLMDEYLGIKPSNMLEGCFQDVHWSSGFGYFPTYALGSAMSAQIYSAMRKDLDVDNLMSNLDFMPINNWLKEKIHKYGRSMKNLDIIKNACGEDFDSKYYIEYLKNKFNDIYNL